MLSVLERASRDISRNVSVQLILITAMVEIRKIFAVTRMKDKAIS
ncbi:MAG: hypothetical protein NTX15_02655 [Candidatus Kapabacteria bacterium]|nr:hypothetical protein [Candidatus Kapabacteria bacterium]